MTTQTLGILIAAATILAAGSLTGCSNDSTTAPDRGSPTEFSDSDASYVERTVNGKERLAQHLTEFIGVPHPLYQKVGIVLLGPVWLFTVTYLHFRHGSKAYPFVAKFDMFIRYASPTKLPIMYGGMERHESAHDSAAHGTGTYKL